METKNAMDASSPIFPSNGCFVATNFFGKSTFISVQAYNGRKFLLKKFNTQKICSQLRELYLEQHDSSSDEKNENNGHHNYNDKLEFHKYFQDLIDFMFKICINCDDFKGSNNLCRKFSSKYKLDYCDNDNLYLAFLNHKWDLSNIDNICYVANKRDKFTFTQLCQILYDSAIIVDNDNNKKYWSSTTLVDDYLSIIVPICDDFINTITDSPGYHNAIYQIKKFKYTIKQWSQMVNEHYKDKNSTDNSTNSTGSDDNINNIHLACRVLKLKNGLRELSSIIGIEYKYISSYDRKEYTKNYYVKPVDKHSDSNYKDKKTNNNFKYNRLSKFENEVNQSIFYHVASCQIVDHDQRGTSVLCWGKTESQRISDMIVNCVTCMNGMTVLSDIIGQFCAGTDGYDLANIESQFAKHVQLK